METIFIPKAQLKSADDDRAAAKRRAQLREALLRGDTVSVSQNGQMNPGKASEQGQPAIEVPPGKLAASFYWYERDEELLNGELQAMKKYFPHFSLETLPDGRLSWLGSLSMSNLRKRSVWFLQAIYDHNHPNNNTYGGSVKVYVIEPDLNQLVKKLGRVPHVLRDSGSNYYLCTAKKEDIRIGNITTTAASAISWASKWISVFELWLAGDVSTSEFDGHLF